MSSRSSNFGSRKTNPQKSLHENWIKTELAPSIKVNGVLGPLIVRPMNGSDVFEIVAVAPHYRGSKYAGRSTVPCNKRALHGRDAQFRNNLA